ncbi:MAG: AgmX/PglI C-terminal domain-containing protein [Deltaproteobacteria bacterium]|nr:AgmX/PglI C-terminal domain-containing protein [Deltaproteobacteria bacterium]
MARSTELEVELPAREEEHQALATLWARARIEELEKEQYKGEQPETVRMITSLGLEHRLVTRYTSFVAVDQTPATEPRSPIRTVCEPVELPDQVSMEDGEGNNLRSSILYRARGVVSSKPLEARGMGGIGTRMDVSGAGDAKPQGLGSQSGFAGQAADLQPTSGPQVDYDFDKIFGSNGSPDTPPPSEPRSRKNVYIPPAPGSSGPTHKAQLQQSDVMEVVVANKGTIKACVDEASLTEADLGGTIVMRWTIRLDGSTSSIVTVTDEYRQTQLAACLSDAIKRWRFPEYFGPQMSPISFPFKFSAASVAELVEKGGKALLREDYRTAARAFRKAFERDPANRDAAFGLEQVRKKAQEVYSEAYLLSQRDPTRARQLLQQLLQMVEPGHELYRKAQKRLEALDGH